MVDKITQTEADLLTNALERILTSAVVIKDLGDNLPKTDTLQDSNKVYTGKASMLFVDMRDSTKLPDKFDAEQLIKIYRSYIRTIVQAIRYSYGVVRDFMGDGVLAVFIDDENGKSEDKAVYAARYITTTIDKFLNPLLDEHFRHRISCGIGIHTGEITLSKVGMKGKEQDEDAESEFGIAWIGNSTNLACKQSGAVDCGTIFISPTTYAALSDLEKSKVWKRFDIEKGSNHLSGYISQQNYLELDKEISPCPAYPQNKCLSLSEILQKKIDELTQKAKELGSKEQELSKKESQLHGKEAILNAKAELLQTKHELVDNSIYAFHCSVIRSGHCQKSYVVAMGQKFWEDHLEKAIVAGAKIGKSEHDVKQEISYAMVSIYESFEIYDKAYDFLVEQAAGHGWLSKGTVQKIVTKIGYCDRLKSALYTRLAKNDLSSHYQEQFEDIKNWLVFDFENNIAPIG